MPFSLRPLMFGLALFFVPQFLLSAGAQNLVVNRIPPSFSSLRQMNRNSRFIFDGTVLSVGRVVESGSDTVPTVQITFRVERAIRGTRNGQVLTIREWAGLWDSGDRYRAGERLLLFLYNPSKLGLTSPVGGPLGRFAVDSGGNVSLENGWLAALSPDEVSRQPLRGRALLDSRDFALAIERSATQRSATPRAATQRSATQRTAAPNVAAE
jgi:hypothetical protein